MKKRIITLLIIALFVILSGTFYYNQSQQISILKQTLSDNSQKDKHAQFTETIIEKLGDEYYVNIPKGNESFCVWRYSAGNGNIPYIEMTKAKTLSEKHHLLLGDAFWDFSVYCFDDWGNNYIGILNKK